MSKYKIGQKIVAEKDFDVKGFFDEPSIPVKKGDEAFIDSKGMIRWQTGKARGKIQKLNDAEMVGYDTKNIANIIIDSLGRYGVLEEILEDYDIDISDIKETIEYALDDIV